MDQRNTGRGTAQRRSPDGQMTTRQIRRRRRRIADLITWCVLLAAIVVMVVSGVYIVRTLLDYRAGEEEYDSLKAQVFGDPKEEEPHSGVGTAPSLPVQETPQEAEDDWQPRMDVCGSVSSLKSRYGDVVGWIDFENMDISYPIMKGADNDEYIRTTYSGESNQAGSIFMEYRNTSDFQDVHTILYGHNMKNGTMFGKLKNYREDDFYPENQYFDIYTTSCVYRYQIFAYYDIEEDGDVYDISFTSADEITKLINNMFRRSYYDTGVPVGNTDKIITLSTCAADGFRFVVNAVRVDVKYAD